MFLTRGGMPRCLLKVIFVVQSLSCVLVFVTPWTAVCQVSCPPQSSGVCSKSCLLSQWCHPTISFFVIPFSLCLLSFPASGFFSSESALHIRWPQYWSFNFGISPSNEYSRLISFRIEGHNGREKSFQVLGIWWTFTFLCNTLLWFSPPCYNKAACAKMSDECVSFTPLYL